MENLDKWEQAGKLAAQTLIYGKSLIRPGASLLEVSDKIESRIHELGAKPAFPVQISMNDIAAHYCADPDDPVVFSDQVCSLDVGVHVDGCIGDNACTVDLSGRHSELLKASAEALKAAIDTVAVGVTLAEIGKAIQETISSFGFAPVRNLSGHGLDLYNIHTSPTVPNFDTGETRQLEKGSIIAIEPFATTGQGMIAETRNANIFSLVNRKPVRNMIARQLLKEIDSYGGLPFTTRILARKFPLFKVNFALRELLQQNIIRSYPPLVEVKHGIVSQAEHTVLVDDEVRVLTMP
ncbi:MAG: type II methionyl aminopeptidase [archaeon]